MLFLVSRRKTRNEVIRGRCGCKHLTRICIEENCLGALSAAVDSYEVAQVALLLSDYGIAECSELFDDNIKDVAGLEQYRRLAKYSHAFRSSRSDHVAGFKSDPL